MKLSMSLCLGTCYLDLCIVYFKATIIKGYGTASVRCNDEYATLSKLSWDPNYLGTNEVRHIRHVDAQSVGVPLHIPPRSPQGDLYHS